jgi:hypothetical protein
MRYRCEPSSMERFVISHIQQTIAASFDIPETAQYDRPNYAEAVRFPLPPVLPFFVPLMLVSPPLCASFSMRIRSRFCWASSSAFTFWYRCSNL